MKRRTKRPPLNFCKILYKIKQNIKNKNENILRAEMLLIFYFYFKKVVIN